MFKFWSAAVVVLLTAGLAFGAGPDFGSLDQDGNGTLDRKEILAGTEKAFQGYDRDGNGSLDKSEFGEAGGSAARFMEIDRNKDGLIDLKEFSEATRRRFRTIDRNRDGRIDAQELKARKAPIENPLFIFHLKMYL